MTKPILFLAIAAVLIAGTVSIDSAFAQKEDKGNNGLRELVNAMQTQIDSFFDVFTEISVHNEDIDNLQTNLDGHVTVLKAKDDAQQNQIDSFFDVWTELSATDANLQSQIDDLVDVRPPTNIRAVDMFIKFDGIDGEAKDDKHQSWSDLLSFDQGQARPDAGSGSSRQRGDVIFDDVVVVKELDKSSPKIAEAVAKGKFFPKVEIEVTASYDDKGRVTYYAYELKNVQVVSYNISGQGQSEDVPVEQFALNFEEIKVTYTELDEKGNSKGNIEYSWKVEEGTP